VIQNRTTPSTNHGIYGNKTSHTWGYRRKSRFCLLPWRTYSV
jgi:hypothetical protein